MDTLSSLVHKDHQHSSTNNVWPNIHGLAQISWWQHSNHLGWHAYTRWDNMLHSSGTQQIYQHMQTACKNLSIGRIINTCIIIWGWQW